MSDIAVSQPLWKPSRSLLTQSQMAQFMQRANSRHKLDLTSYSELWQWSIDHREDFWALLWDFFDVNAERRWETVLKHDAMPGAKWFDGARLNFAENLLRFRDERTAILFRNETGTRRSFTYAELYRKVSRVRAGLDAAGVKKGDRVAAYLPNMPETIIIMLAATSLGAMFSSTSPDFGIEGVTDRFGQIEPKILFAADGYSYNGKCYDSLARMPAIQSRLPSVEQIIIVPHLSDAPAINAIPLATHYADFLGEPHEINFAPLPFDHPQFILYSSGTTGQPKCIVHGLGGVLLEHLKELGLHTNVTRDDVLFYFTTCGWMMWNWLASGFALGATILLYDGAPMRGGADAMLRMAEEEKITVFGTSAKFISALEKAGVGKAAQKQLATVRTILSTGSPLMPENFDYVYNTLKPDVQLSSISGGTDIVSCFALGSPLVPVYRGELQCRGLGMAVAIYNDEGKPVRNEKGELVCTRSFPVMPVQFWNDPDGKRYHKAYFEQFDNVWCHGDWAELTDHDGLIIYGRSDAVLNPGGVRIGTAEIYRQVEKLDEVLESIAIGQQWNGDTRIILFVKLRPQIKLNNALRTRIRNVIRDNATSRHVPAKIIAIPDIPRTISGKIVELAVTKIIHGQPVKNADALANPESLDYYRDLPELQKQ